MIRCERRLGTHGFFVAVFVRKNKKTPAPVLKAEKVDKASESVVVEKEKKEKKEKKKQEKIKKEEAPKKTTTKRADTGNNGKEVDGPDFTLLRLATLDRKRRARMTALRAIRKLSSDQHGRCCGCAH